MITPLKVPASVTHLVVFGGSFDPPHAGHVDVPAQGVDRLYGKGGWLLYVPAAQSPHKPSGPHASNADRLAMLTLALAGVSRCSVWTDELDRPSTTPSYTVGTLRRLRSIVPKRVTLRLLIGTDQVRAFHRWRSPRAIIRIAEPLVLARDPDVLARDILANLDPKFWTQAERAAWCSRLAPNDPLPAASTDLRAAIASAGPAAWRAAPLNLLNPAVADHIRDHGLYGAKPRSKGSKNKAHRLEPVGLND